MRVVYEPQTDPQPLNVALVLFDKLFDEIEPSCRLGGREFISHQMSPHLVRMVSPS